MTNVVSALTARTQLGQIIKRATQRNERFVVDRRGKPAVIIMSLKDYIDTLAPTPAWLKAIGQKSKRNGLNKLSCVRSALRSPQRGVSVVKRQH
jgi:prevent-host-death family protein